MYYKDMHDTPKPSETGKLILSWILKGRGPALTNIERGFIVRDKGLAILSRKHGGVKLEEMRAHFLTPESIEGLKNSFGVNAEEAARLDAAYKADCDAWKEKLLETMRAPENIDMFMHALALYHGNSSSHSVMEKIYRDLSPQETITNFTNKIMRTLRRDAAPNPAVCEAFLQRCPVPEGILLPPALAAGMGEQALPGGFAQAVESSRTGGKIER